MNLNFSQSTGLITKDDGTSVAHGWAGNDSNPENPQRIHGKLNPDKQALHKIGPLPQGVYSVGPWEEKHGHLGAMVAPLTQISGETFGRDAFYIHGPDRDPATYGQESLGCIVVPHAGRQAIKDLGPETVTVTA
ncbi:MAG: hypothetical protein P4L11_13630 [Geothrix sp.]|nr:hypothetical protein [Geothrix sp.]